MNINKIAVALPSWQVTNADIIRLVEQESKSFEGDFHRALSFLERSLEKSGAHTRLWRGEDESPLSLTKKACSEALCGVNDVDLLIYASVWAELFEPSSANLVAYEIALDRAECFDMKAACDGWMKAVKLADSLLTSGQYRKIMVVNAEFNMMQNAMIYPRLFNLVSAEELEWRFPAFTIGEAATATILSANPKKPWKFHNETHNNLYDLCTVTMPWYGTHPLSERIGKDGAGLFTSYGVDLRRHGLPLAVETFRTSGIDSAAVDILFTHSSSKSDWTEGARQIGLEHKLYDIYARCGNVVSASVPTALALAEQDGTLVRGKQVAAWVASAGM